MFSSLRSGWIPLLAAALLAFAPASAGAAPTEKDKADSKAAYTEARAAAAAGRHADAAKAFRRADELDPNPQYRLEMAKSLAADGKLIEASKVLNELMDVTPPIIWSVKSAAKKDLESIEQRIPWLQIKVEGPEQKLTSTTVDGKEIDAENEVPINPGEHVIAADADGYEPAEQTVTIAEGAHEVVTLTLTRKGGAVKKTQPTADAVTPTPSTKSSGGGLGEGPLFIPMVASFGVGVVGVGVGTVFGIMALSDTAEAKEDCKGNTCPDTTKVRKARDAALVEGNVSTVAFIVGGVGLAAGGVLLGLQLMAPSPPPKGKEEAFVRPYVGVGQAGVYGAF